MVSKVCDILMLRLRHSLFLSCFLSHSQLPLSALKHPWISASKRPSFHRRHSSECIGGTYGTTKMAPRVSLDVQICKSIEMFATYSWLHRLALMVIGYKYTGKETNGTIFLFSSIKVTLLVQA